ncbi:MAG: hypothetical protein M3R27_09025 [Bacteroidota bacterium]|nr:hypothetical protein [Bacteroidota bacterium]
MKIIQIVKLRSFALFVLSLFCFIPHFISAQTGTSSPYSRYGIGDLSGKGYSQGFALGGTHIAMQNDSTQMFFINSGNPASYSNIRLTTIELGANYVRNRLESTAFNKTINNASLGYISLAFPLKKWWGASIGLVPYSSVGYNISDRQEIYQVGTVDFLYEGTGGVNQVYFGNGIKPFYGLPRMYARSAKYKALMSPRKADNTLKTAQELSNDKAAVRAVMKRKKAMQGLSLGVNASYLFGGYENTRRSIFDPANYSFNTRARTTTRVSDFYMDYGLQYSFLIDSVKTKDSTGRVYKRDLRDNVKFTFGATFAAQTDINAKIDTLSVSYFYSSTGNEIVKDTIELSSNTKGSIKFPLSFGFGLGFKKGDRWMVAADFALQNWSTYTAFNQSQGLKNSMRVSLGIQYVPDAKANASYPKRIHYRVGGRFAQTALELKSTQLTEMAASFGVGFPVGRNYLLQNFSMVNIGVELGKRGTIDSGLIQENFFKATIGFTINDRWFVKPKFD